VLPVAERMRSAIDFALTVRSGVRAGRTTVVVHARRPPPASSGEPGQSGLPGQRVRVGFVVPKAVGGAVVRNRVKRRLRHLARPEVARTPSDTHLVVRALPPAASSARLAGDLSSAWTRCLDRLDQKYAAPANQPLSADQP